MRGKTKKSRWNYENAEVIEDKSLRDDMLRVMQYKFTEAAKAETADLPFKDVGKGNAEG